MELTLELLVQSVLFGIVGLSIGFAAVVLFVAILSAE